MKKFLDKSFIFQGLGILVLVLELLIVHFSLPQLNIITYLLVIGIIPAAILFVTSLLHSATTKCSFGCTYLTALVMALIFSGIMLAYCSVVITPELIDTILANSITSETTQVSMTTATTGDNIQSILIFIAFSGIGAFVGNHIRKKRETTPDSVESEYDD